MVENMHISEKKSMTIGVILSYVSLFAGILISIFYSSFVLKSIGSEEYGIRTFGASIVSYLSYLAVGMSNAYIRFRFIEKKEKGLEGEKHLNGIFMAFFIIVGLLALIIGGLIIGFFYWGIIPLNENYGSDQKMILMLVMLIMVLNTAIYFPLSTYRMFIVSEKKFIWINAIGLLDTILSPIVTIIVLLVAPNGSVGAVGITWIVLFCNIFLWLLNTIFALVPLKMKMTLKLNKNDFQLFKKIIVFSLIAFIITTAISLNPITDKVVLGFAKDATVVTIYQFSVVFTSYLAAMATAISGVFGPRLTQDVIDGDMANVQRTFNLIMRVSYIVLAFIVGGYIACGQSFVQGWIVDETTGINAAKGFDIYLYSCVLLASQLLTFGPDLSISIQCAANKHKIPAVIFVSVFVFNIIVSIALVFSLGIWGCIIGTVISYVIESIAISIYNTKVLKLKMSYSWLSLLRSFIVTLIPVLITFGIYYLINTYSPLNISQLTSNDGLNPWLETLIRGLTFVILFVGLELVVDHKFIKEFFAKFKSRKVDVKSKEKELESVDSEEKPTDINK